MSTELLTIPLESEVQDCITSISIWLQTHSHAGPQQTPEEICCEDLAIAVPGECLFPELGDDNDIASREDEKGVLVYTDSKEEKYIWIKSNWQIVENVMDVTAPKNGWIRAGTLGERLLVLILTQLDYTAREIEAEVPYGCCPHTDPTYLLWIEHKPVGMCSLKPKGTKIWGGEEEYICDTLDTLYVRTSARRQGHTLSLLRTLTLQLPPGEHLALSYPVSLSMCKVLAKFITVFPELRDTLWTLDEDGEVSGTVELMLGSLMMRGGLQGHIINHGPLSHQITSHPQQQPTQQQQPQQQQPQQQKQPPPQQQNQQQQQQNQQNQQNQQQQQLQSKRPLPQQQSEPQETDEPCDTS